MRDFRVDGKGTIADVKSVLDHTNNAEAWLSIYEDEHFEQQLEGIFDQVRPLYEQIHGYVRQKLNKQYGSEIVCPNGPIPMHLLRNMWGQSWEHVSGHTTTYFN